MKAKSLAIARARTSRPGGCRRKARRKPGRGAHKAMHFEFLNDASTVRERGR